MAQDPISSTQTATAPVAATMPDKTQLVPLAQQAIQVALSTVQTGATSDQTVAAVATLATSITAVGEQAAAAGGGPIAGMAADAVLPQLATALAPQVVTLMEALQMEVTKEYQRLTAWLSKL